MLEPRVRSAEPDDVDGLTALLNAIIERGGTTAFQEPFRPELLAERYLFGPSVISAVVAESGEPRQSVGFQTLTRSADLPSGWADIATYVEIGRTGAGIGRALFSQTAANAKTAGIHCINATIRADNDRGLAYYSRVGFVPFADGPVGVLPNGNPMRTIRERFLIL